MIVYQAVKGRQLRIPLRDSSSTTGLTLADFVLSSVISGDRSADPEADLTLVLDEVDSTNLAGYYELALTPTEDGLTYLLLVDNDDHELVFQVAHEALDLLGASLYGEEGTLEITVEDSGEDPIEGVTVRILTATGGGLVARALTDSSGEANFDLPEGTYYARFSKTGYDFSAVNPTSVVVIPWAGVSPVVEELLPSSAAEGDQVVVRGRYFNGTNVVVLCGSTEVTPTDISEDGTILVFAVPAESSPATVRVQKDDPDGGDDLVSASLSLTVS
jgi:hypothetical protein